MALVALHLDVLALQRIARGVVLLDAKQRWLPAFDRMAFRAFTLLRPRCKLTFVRVRLMAAGAIRKWQRLFEITVNMALRAVYRRVLAKQRIFGLRVIELFGGFPIREVMALQAVVAELPLMRILVTRYAILGQAKERF